MTNVLPAHVQRVLEDVAKREGFANPRFEVSPAAKVGDSYISLLFRVLVKHGDGGNGESLSFVVKTLPLSRKRRQMMQCGVYFMNEVNMYQTVLPALAEFQRERGLAKIVDGTYPNVPRCYEIRTEPGEDADSEECTIALQDLRPLGFVNRGGPRREPIDLEHLRLVIRQLAELHATSLSMEHAQPDKFAPVRAVMRETLYSPENPESESMNRLCEQAYGFFKHRFPEGSEGYKRAKAMLDNVMENMRIAASPDPEGGNSVLHGDCWGSNLLFKYREPGHHPEKFCFLDFQVSRYGPPILDLMHLFYTCTDLALRRAHRDTLLREYHAHLSATIDALLGKAGAAASVYSWETMQRQLKRSGRYGFGCTALFLPLFMAENDDVPDLDAGFNDGADTKDLFSKTKRAVDPERDNRMADILEDMLDLGYL